MLHPKASHLHGKNVCVRDTETGRNRDTHRFNKASLPINKQQLKWAGKLINNAIAIQRMDEGLPSSSVRSTE